MFPEKCLQIHNSVCISPRTPKDAQQSFEHQLEFSVYNLAHQFRMQPLNSTAEELANVVLVDTEELRLAIRFHGDPRIVDEYIDDWIFISN